MTERKKMIDWEKKSVIIDARATLGKIEQLVGWTKQCLNQERPGFPVGLVDFVTLSAAILMQAAKLSLLEKLESDLYK